MKIYKKRFIPLFLITMCIMLCACSASSSNNVTDNENLTVSNDTNAETPETANEIELNINKSAGLEYETGFTISSQYSISDENYKMYNDILDVLNSDYSKTEDELLAGLTSKYGMSVSQLKKFMMDNMDAAIDRDSGKTIGGSSLSDEQVIVCGKNVIFRTLDNENIYIPSDSTNWTISSTGLRYVLTTSLEVDNSNVDAIIKIEFNDDYSKYTLFQLKYNGMDVELD